MTKKNKLTGSSLTPKQELFCMEYLKDLNATQAALRCEYSVKSAKSQGNRMLTNDDIAQRIYELNQERIKEVKIDADFVLGELFKIANSDIQEIFKEDGTLRPISEIPSHIRKAISSFEVVETFEKEGKATVWTGYVKKIKLWSKDKSLENLGRHLKLFTDKLEHSGDEEKPIAVKNIDIQERLKSLKGKG